jgi:hypothetical protein
MLSQVTRCPLYPQKRTSMNAIVMSALCQKRTHAAQPAAPNPDVAVRQPRRALGSRALRRPCALDDDISPRASDYGLDLRLLGLGHGELVKGLLEIVEKRVPLGRSHESPPIRRYLHDPGKISVCMGLRGGAGRTRTANQTIISYLAAR